MLFPKWLFCYKPDIEIDFRLITGEAMPPFFGRKYELSTLRKIVDSDKSNFYTRGARMKYFLATVTLTLASIAHAKQPQQLLVVGTDDWNSTHASATRFEGQPGAWQLIGATQPAVVGNNGMGWGIGLHPTDHLPAGPQKNEGDQRSPAGLFPISFGFGRLSNSEIGNANFAYDALKESTECVDDGDSHFYNRIVDRTQVKVPDWSSSEKMFFEPLYLVGAFVAHNPNATKGKGSCIFLHVWPGTGRGTAGCTAFPEANIRTYLKWFDTQKNPVLVQLPKQVYAALQESWQLPSLH